MLTPDLPPSQQGFILTRHWRDAPNGTEIEFWLATDDGPRKIRLTTQTSVAFAEARERSAIEALLDKSAGVELRELQLKTFEQEPVIGVYSSRYKQLTALERTLRDHGIKMYEADIRPPERYLMERFITAGVQVEGGRVEGTTIHDCKLKPASDYRPKLKMVSLDIETSAYEDLYSIALEGCGQRQVYMLGAAPAEAPGDIGFDLEYCATPRQLIERLNAWMARHDPDVLVGWNVVQFDLRVLQKNADKHKIALTLGREGKTIEWREHPGKQGYMFAPVVGRVVLDGIDALKAASWMFPSFSLENVSQAMLGEGKDIGDVYDKMAEIERRFQEDKPALAHYNLKDCELVTRIFDKANLLAFMIERATVTGLQADHLGGSIAAFGHHYLPRMHREGYVAPNVGDISGGASPGGFVMDSKPGLYDSVVVLDYKSLYPSIIRTFLVDPVGLIEGEVAEDPASVVEGVNGTVFSRHKHCLPEITTQIWKQRDAAKRAKNEPLSQALKLLMNSFCGVLGATECRFFNPRLVSSVTLRGHQMMKQTRELVEAEGYDVIYGDTDSIFIWLKKEHKNADALEIGQQLANKINGWWRAMLKEKHGLECYLEIEFDTHFQKFFMPTIRGTETGSKKRYAGLTINAKGEDEVIYRGLEVARSDWTPLAQQFQKGLFMRIFKDEPYQDFVRDYARKTLSGDFDELLVYRKRLRHRLDEYKVNVPPQVRAARLADEYNQSHHRPLRYQNGGWISYVMTTGGPEPLEAMRSNIDYDHYLTKQLQPIADSILLPMKDSFASLTTSQASLFKGATMNDFKKLHDGSKLLHLPNAWDAGSARLFESLGAPAIATTSAGVAWAAGYADGDNMPADVAIAVAINIARVLTVPLSVDLENGYSDDPNVVAQNAMKLVNAGVAGVNLEDGGGTPEALAAKIVAIKKLVAASGKDIFINTRTDVYLRGLAPEGERVAEVLKRAAVYKAAGADGLFVPGICKVDEIKAVVAGAGLPVNVMDWPGVPSADELHKLGVRRLSAGSGIPQALWAVAADMAKGFLATGNAGPLIEKAMPYGELQALFVKS